MRMFPSSSPANRRAPAKWAYSATFPRFGIRSRRPRTPPACAGDRTNRDRDALPRDRGGLDRGLLEDQGARLGSVTEEDRVELGADDLVSEAGPGLVLGEVEGVRFSPLPVHEARPVLHKEARLLDRLVPPEPVQDRQVRR